MKKILLTLIALFFISVVCASNSNEYLTISFFECNKDAQTDIIDLKYSTLEKFIQLLPDDIKLSLRKELIAICNNPHDIYKKEIKSGKIEGYFYYLDDEACFSTSYYTIAIKNLHIDKIIQLFE